MVSLETAGTQESSSGPQNHVRHWVFEVLHAFEINSLFIFGVQFGAEKPGKCAKTNPKFKMRTFSKNPINNGSHIPSVSFRTQNSTSQL